MSTNYNDNVPTSMNARQAQALRLARERDLVLVEDANFTIPGIPVATRNRLLLITRVRDPNNSIGPVMLVREFHSRRSQDWILFRSHPEEYFRTHGRGRPDIAIQLYLNNDSHIILWPSNDVVVRRIFGGICPYEHCNEGLVRITPTTLHGLPAFASEPRESEPESWTLCRFCMSEGLFHTHERLVQEWPNLDYERQGLYNEHIAAVDFKLDVMGYTALPPYTSLPHLTSRTHPMRTTWHRRRQDLTATRFVAVPAPIDPSRVRYMPKTRPVSWYCDSEGWHPEATCSICYELYVDDGEHMITELHCGHFFHDECVVKWVQGKTQPQCPFRCAGEVWM